MAGRKSTGSKTVKTSSSIEEERVVGVSDNTSVFADTINIPSRFSYISKMILRDLNKAEKSPYVFKYTKDDIVKYLRNPYKFEKELRNAVNYIYSASTHFRRLIQYFTGLSDLSYVVSPYNINPKNANKNSVSRNYRKTLNMLSTMSIRTQFPKILTVCLREDVYYGTFWINNDSITVQQLPSDYCYISSIEGNVFNVSFDFSYFDTYTNSLDFYPEEFKNKYHNIYKKNVLNNRYIELDAPYSFAIKCNSDILKYASPPFVGVLREIYDIEDYKALKLTKTELENYAMLVMTLGIDENGNWTMDLNKAKEFYYNLESVLPEEVGSVLSPMPISKISFERNHNGDGNTIEEAENNLFTAAGVSSLLFNNPKASANALLLSIKADQAITFGIVKSIQDVVNRLLHSQPYGKFFKVTFLDCSPFNRKEVGDMYLKACQYGMPMVSYYCASQGLSQEEMDSMNFLENDILKLKEKLVPLKSSATLSSKEGNGATEEGGAPRKDGEDIQGESTESMRNTSGDI